MSPVRTLPIRVAPLPGEALDSWLEALMHRLAIDRRDLTFALGLDQTRRRLPPNWMILLDDEVSSALSQATDVAPARLQAMTLAHYDGVALVLNHERRQVIRSRLWGRGTGSRYCPQCLATNGGRWPLAWRLGWSFVCATHHAVLADICPRCTGTPRTRQLWLSEPKPAICYEPADPTVRGRALIRCGHDLTNVTTLSLAVDHPAVIAQQIINDVIGTGTAAFGIYAGQPVAAASMLADLKVLTARILNHLSVTHIGRFLPADIVSAHEQALTLPLSRYRAGRADSRPGAIAPAYAAISATAVTAGMLVLNAADDEAAANTLRELILRPGPGESRPANTPTWEQPATTTMAGIYLKAVARPSLAVDQLRPHRWLSGDRWQTTQSRSHLTPASFWPGWLIRMTPAELLGNKTSGPALACALMISGNTLSMQQSARALGLDAVLRGASGVGAALRRLGTHPHWPDILAAIAAIAHYVDHNGSPIDYRRRRSLDYQQLLPTAAWEQIRADAGMPLLHHRWRQVARCFLFQRISGLPATAAPAEMTAGLGAMGSELRLHSMLLTPDLLSLITEAGIKFLHDSGVTDEPLTWEPPPTLCQSPETVDTLIM